MWLWLRKMLPKSFQLWAQLAAYVGGLHFMLMFGLFFVYKGDNHSLSFTLNRHIDVSAAVVFLPLQKKAGIQNVSGSAKKSSDAVGQVEAKKIPEKEPKALKVTKIKPEKSTTLASVVSPKQKAKPATKKSKKIVAQKKDTPVQEQKEPLKEIAPVAVTQAPKIEDKPVAAISTDVASANVGCENIQYLGQHDLDALQMEEIIKSEISRCWSPPPGISKNAVCEGTGMVGWDGMVNNFTIKKSSGIAIYDVTARNALLKVSFPKQFWGKEISIVFKQ